MEGGYKKDLTILMDIEDGIEVVELLKEIVKQAGKVAACRMVGKERLEITMKDQTGKMKITDGVLFKGKCFAARELRNKEMVVSFLTMPAYIADEEILGKLKAWGVEPASELRRKMWTGTDIADGTRYLKVKFTDQVTSLPYSTRFDTETGPEYIRVIHDRQVQVCRHCIRPGHVFRNCPELICFSCRQKGHLKKDCQVGLDPRNEDVDLEQERAREKRQREEPSERESERPEEQPGKEPAPAGSEKRQQVPKKRREEEDVLEQPKATEEVQMEADGEAREDSGDTGGQVDVGLRAQPGHTARDGQMEAKDEGAAEKESWYERTGEVEEVDLDELINNARRNWRNRRGRERARASDRVGRVDSDGSHK